MHTVRSLAGFLLLLVYNAVITTIVCGLGPGVVTKLFETSPFTSIVREPVASQSVETGLLQTK